MCSCGIEKLWIQFRLFFFGISQLESHCFSFQSVTNTSTQCDTFCVWFSLGKLSISLMSETEMWSTKTTTPHGFCVINHVRRAPVRCEMISVRRRTSWRSCDQPKLNSTLSLMGWSDEAVSCSCQTDNPTMKRQQNDSLLEMKIALAAEARRATQSLKIIKSLTFFRDWNIYFFISSLWRQQSIIRRVYVRREVLSLVRDKTASKCFFG